ncbi:MAG: hydrolase, partial [Acidobacteria bacterium]|nr:hydrolase [Acidobacteriota bacterium]
LSLNFQTFVGGFFSGSRVTLNPTVRIRPSEAFNVELAYSRNDVDLPEGEFVTNLLRTRISYAFSARTFIQSLVQYNDRADIWSVNLRFGWLQAANTGLFIVYNDTRGLYDLFPERPERTDRSLTIKFSRMFDVLR